MQAFLSVVRPAWSPVRRIASMTPEVKQSVNSHAARKKKEQAETCSLF
jgi:hypothetical protein